MESTKQQSSQRIVIVSIGVAAVALTAAISALTLSVYQNNRIQELEQDRLTVRQFLSAFGVQPMVSDDERINVFKRSAGEEESSNDKLLSELTLTDLAAFRGPPGRDGRDGRDGKDCDITDIESLLSLIYPTTSSTSTVTSEATTPTRSPGSLDFDEDELLERFNETIGHAILRGIQLTNTKLAELEGSMDSVKQHASSSSGSSDGVSTNVRGGSAYVRWGRTTCGNTSEMLYTGFAAGTHYTQTGGASNYQCLPLQPEFSTYLAGEQGAWVYGAEYETGSNIFPQTMQNKNVPCARCYVPTRSASIMIPAKMTCPAGWTKEYDGYLMAGHHTHKRAYAYECMDKEPEAIAGKDNDQNGALFYFQQISCGSTGHCPPYIEAAELTCVVCTK